MPRTRYEVREDESVREQYSIRNTDVPATMIGSQVGEGMKFFSLSKLSLVVDAAPIIFDLFIGIDSIHRTRFAGDVCTGTASN
jgi:hypothetical protein